MLKESTDPSIKKMRWLVGVAFFEIHCNTRSLQDLKLISKCSSRVKYAVDFIIKMLSSFYIQYFDGVSNPFCIIDD